ncbi:MAG: ROK family protein [Chloroflexota bacterium]|nr:ROK family protein [Chloroflexota bacterium]
MKTPQPMAIGIDVGATKIAAALVSVDGNVLVAREKKTRVDEGAQVVIDQIAWLVNEIAGSLTTDLDRIPISLLGVGIGIPGQVNSKDGIVRDAVNLGWDEVYLVEALQSHLVEKFPVLIETDTNASTLGEFTFGAARGCQDFVYISIGSGLGAGLIINGRLVLGSTWKAAELGHISLDPDGLQCACGLHGCAETIISGPGLLNLVTQYLSQGKYPTRLSTESELTTSAVVSAALDGDDLALAVFSEMGRCLGIIISFCAALINPTLIVIGGGLGLAAFDLIVPTVWQEIRRRTLFSVYSELKIVPSQQVSSAIGAASLIFSNDLGDA